MKELNNEFLYKLKEGSNTLDFSNGENKEIVIENEVNLNSSLLLTHLKDVGHIKIVLKSNGQLLLSTLLEDNINDLNIVIDVYAHSELNAFFADFSKENLKLNVTINLKEEKSSCLVRLASLCADKDNKAINISVNHETKNTYAKVDNYGVCKDEGKSLFAGTSYIYHGSIKSKTEQNAKIMVFDESSDAIAKPILKIDENDIEASHAAVVGKINDEHLFYLTSRGLSIHDAKELITLGYLKPILLGFSDDKTKDYISSLIERRM